MVRTTGNVLLMLLFPVIWGLLSAWAFDHLQARWPAPTEGEDTSEGKERR